MSDSLSVPQPLFRQLFSIAAIFLAGCAMMGGEPGTSVSLTGAEEVPAVTTTASGTGLITVLADHSVSGSITFSGFAATAAHIHEAAAGKNGPVIVPFSKTSGTSFDIPSGAKLADSQYASYQAGHLYLNVHSAAHPGGEIRGQIKPPSAASAPRQPTRMGY